MLKFDSVVEVIGPSAGEALDVLGAPVVLKSGGDPRRMTFADHAVPPGYGVPLHLHDDEDELFYLLEGELTLVTQTGEMTAGAGSFVHLPRGAPHGFRNATDRPCRMLVVTTPGGALEGVFRGLDAAARQGPLEPAEVGAICAANRVRTL